MSLAGMGLNEVIVEGSSATDDQINAVRLRLRHEHEQDSYEDRTVVVFDSKKATTTLCWDGEADAGEASEELLSTALELVRHAAND